MPLADSTLWGLDAAAWQAIAAWVAILAAVVVAGLTARYAKGQVEQARQQVDEARTLRREQAMPNPVVYLDRSPAGHIFIDVVLANFGPTAATDVHLTIEPHPRRNPDGDQMNWPDAFPTLAPGQRVPMFFTSLAGRADKERFPDVHHATITYTGLGEQHTVDYVLDLRMLSAQAQMQVKTQHNLVKVAEDVRGLLTELVRRGG